MKQKLTLLLPLLILQSFFSLSQVRVTGTVVDENNEPLPGVAVVIKGTTRGTSTDFDGKYAIEAIAEEELFFSMVGMVSQTIPIGDKTIINVVLENETDRKSVV